MHRSLQLLTRLVTSDPLLCASLCTPTHSGTSSLVENADSFGTEESNSILEWDGGSILSMLQIMHQII